MNKQRGGFALGLVVGLLVGLALALGVALYITKAPVPFINKVPQRTAEQDSAETERNKRWDPNAALGGKIVPRPVAAASEPQGTAAVGTPAASAPGATLPPGGAAAAASASKAAGKDPAAILAGGSAGGPAGGPAGTAPVPASPQPPARSTATPVETFIYFVQVGAYTRSDEAEQQRGKLGLMGQTARITEREQAGRTVYRVRLGPFPARDEADALQGKLQGEGIETQIVRVEKP